MTAVSLSVIVPTCGRTSIVETVASVMGQLRGRDEVLLVCDGPQREARILSGVLRGISWLEAYDARSRYGNVQRDAGMRAASGTHLLFCDDDDAYLPGALAIIRAAVEPQPDRPHIFRARWGPGHPACGTVLWRDRELRVGNVGTPMVCLPNRRYLSSWMEHNGDGHVSDFGFLADAIGEAGRPVWHRDVIAIVRP